MDRKISDIKVKEVMLLKLGKKIVLEKKILEIILSCRTDEEGSFLENTN
jgi:hypothetical protein